MKSFKGEWTIKLQPGETNIQVVAKSGDKIGASEEFIIPFINQNVPTRRKRT